MTLQLHDTASRAIRPLTPADPSRVTMYTCGLTVYDFGHIGNFRSFLAADLLRRWIESPLCVLTTPGGSTHAGPREVTHVMNITDVGHMTDDADADGAGEDKMGAAGERLLEAKKSGRLPPGVEVDPNDPRAVAQFYIDRFIEDALAVGLKVASDAERDPTLMPRATGAIEGMIDLARTLIERGAAYVVGEPGGRVVYFDVGAFPRYGELSGNTLEHLSAGAGGRVSDANQSSKRNPADFLLWKEDATHLMRWPSPWGEGYPGWHIECSAMLHDRLAQGRPPGAPMVDIHTGGEDNIFPHHECENAQSCCGYADDPARARLAGCWFHPRFLLVDGEKMSKSRGNFFTIRDVLKQGAEPGALRLALIGTHYRANASFSQASLGAAQRTVERMRRIAEVSGNSAGSGGTSTWADASEIPADHRGFAGAFAGAMHEDLNIAGAMGELNRWMNGLSEPTPDDARTLRTIDLTLGLLDLARPRSEQRDIGVFIGVEPDPAIEQKLRDRREARANKDFATADAIRDDLASMGYQIKDAPGGAVEVRRS